MESFKGPGWAKMITVTLVVHAVVILGTSVAFLSRTVSGKDGADLSKEERLEKAMSDATGSLQAIAKEHGLSARELSEQLSRASAPQKVSAVNPETPEKVDVPVAPGPKSPDGADPETPKSDIERELEKKADGPTLPDVSGDIEEDLFK